MADEINDADKAAKADKTDKADDRGFGPLSVARVMIVVGGRVSGLCAVWGGR
ncbi:hypothetical protein ABZ547_26955 [Streptomyces sparsogenes]|uniref:hypothetical protein n=1 Tax=Streptomyces sparsogenes TaxID=67365 RepID=UPI0033CA15AE